MSNHLSKSESIAFADSIASYNRFKLKLFVLLCTVWLTVFSELILYEAFLWFLGIFYFGGLLLAWLVIVVRCPKCGFKLADGTDLFTKHASRDSFPGNNGKGGRFYVGVANSCPKCQVKF